MSWSPRPPVLHGLSLQDSHKLIMSQIFGLHQFTNVLIDLFELLLTQAQFLLCLSDCLGSVFDGIDDAVELREEIFLAFLVRCAALISQSLLQVLQPDFPMATPVQVLEDSKKFLLANIANQIIDITQIQIALPFDIDNSEQSLDLRIAEFVFMNSLIQPDQL